MEPAQTRATPFVWSQFDAYLFDIDGTLLNTRDGVHYHAFRNALRALFGIEGTIDGVPVHGSTDPAILRAVLAQAGIASREFERKLPDLTQHMCDEFRRNAAGIRAEICPRVPELLNWLRERGKLLGVVSGNLEPIGWAKVKAAGLREYFVLGTFSGRHEERVEIFREGVEEVRRLLPGASVCIVGDTPSDIAAARTIGVPIIAVATGIFPREELAKLAPNLCVSCCTELLPPD